MLFSIYDYGIIFCRRGLFQKRYCLPNNLKLNIEVIVSDVSSDDISYENRVLWGAENSRTYNKIEKISISKNGEVRLMRYSLFSDLVNINTIFIKENDQGFLIKIDGGQTSTHYKVEMQFDEQAYLVSRYVYHTSFKDEVWEKTEYSFIRRLDM